jgi:cysteine desulfurase family protein (TIGR01976 family)
LAAVQPSVKQEYHDVTGGMMELDPVAARIHFPALQRQHSGESVIYFDNPAGTQLPSQAIDGFVHYLKDQTANTGGAFASSEATDMLIGEARQAAADYLGASSSQEIVFGPNMTTLTFQLAHALGRVLEPGDEIVTTRLEHDANISPWLSLQARGVLVNFIEFHPEDGTLDLQSAEKVIGKSTRLVAVGYASNLLGTINDVRRIIDLAHAAGAWAFVDAVHYAPHGPIDVQALGCDFLACSAYKFFGPHLGILYGRAELLATLPADHVRPAGDVPPESWETGTLNHEGLSALCGTFRYLESLHPDATIDRGRRLHEVMTAIKKYELGLSQKLVAGLLSVPGMHVYGLTDPARFVCRVPTVSFTVEGHEPRVVARELGRCGIFSWDGNHYAIEPLGPLGLETTQRVGLVHYNTEHEIRRFVEVLSQICHMS